MLDLLNMKSKLIISAALCCLSALCAKAQFYTNGNEPYSVKWSRIETAHYKVIYPRGLDSLARVYARTLEQAAAVVGNSAGFEPNGSYRSRMPVVLHTYAAYSNGMVMWIPRRMELQTQPDPDYPEPTPWERQLVLHESRHVSQMQPGAAKPFKAWNYLIGELAPGAVAAIYPGQVMMEGDAVAAETALSKGGRGRTADFLEYYRVSFAAGDFRDFWKWRYGSQKNYTPDYYRAGYVLLAGMRSVYNRPDFMADYFGRIERKHGFSFLGPSVREVSGKKFNATFREISDTLAARWSADEKARAPFISSSQRVASPKVFTEYKALAAAGDTLFAVRESLVSPDELVRITPDGKVRRLKTFSSSYTGLRYSPASGMLYWSEYSKDPRWEQVSSSDIRCLDSHGVRHTLTHSRRLYHPAPSPDGRYLSVTEYPVEGGCKVLILNAHSGDILGGRKIPDGLQVIETVWIGDDIYASALSDGGYGIWKLDPLECVLGPQTVKIKRLWERGGKLMFTSDLSGVNELYSLDPSEGELRRLTSTRFGADDFQFNAAGDTLYYSALSTGGRLICSTPADSLLCAAADFGTKPEFPFAEELSSGEKQQVDYTSEVPMSEPRKYSKLLNAIKIHSWAPLYIDYDEVASISSSSLTSSAWLGATAFFQNELGNAYGSAAYKAGYSYSDGWRHSGHLRFTYRGFYPVIETSLDFNERNALTYYLETDKEQKTISLKGSDAQKPLAVAQVNVYIPISTARSGLTLGLIPQVKYAFTNDRSTATGYEGYLSRVTTSLRGYLLESIPSSRVYPRWGIGAEICYSTRPGALSKLLGSGSYIYLYGYTPGLYRTHGLKLTALYASQSGNSIFSEAVANTVPRGFESDINSILASLDTKAKFTADYVMPIFPVDWSALSPVAYVRNFELTPHADLGVYKLSSGYGSLCSAGANFCVRLGNLLWIPYPTRIGLSYNYNFGSLYNTIESRASFVQRHSLGFVFSVEM